VGTGKDECGNDELLEGTKMKIKYTAPVLALFYFYALGAFITTTFDISKWALFVRFSVAVFGSGAAIVVIGLTKTEE